MRSAGSGHSSPAVRALLGYFAATPKILRGEDVRGRPRGGIFLSTGGKKEGDGRKKEGDGRKKGGGETGGKKLGSYSIPPTGC